MDGPLQHLKLDIKRKSIGRSFDESSILSHDIHRNSSGFYSSRDVRLHFWQYISYFELHFSSLYLNKRVIELAGK